MNWSEFFAMDGRAVYVWGSFGALAVCVLIEVIVLRVRRADTLAQLREEALAQQLGGSTKERA